MKKIFISTVPFGSINNKPLQILKENQFDILINPLGRKLLPHEVAQYAGDVDGIIAGTEDLNELIETNSKLQIISRVGIGLDSVPLSKCQKKGITVTYTPDAVTMAVAEMVIGAMITLTRHMHIADRTTRANHWHRLMGKRIQHSIIGLIGFGRIGYNVARLLTPFQPEKILVNDIINVNDKIDYLKHQGMTIERASKDKLYEHSDILSLHVPLSPLTTNLINTQVLTRMKPESYLLNYARGGIVNEQDLHQALKKGVIAGAAIDTFVNEPYYGELIDDDNILLTQHMGSCSYDCRYEMEIQATKDLIRFFQGKPLKNQVPAEEYAYQKQSL